MDTQAGTSGVSRRRIVKGAAWAVPAVAVVAASPAYAKSGCPEVAVTSGQRTGNVWIYNVTVSGLMGGSFTFTPTPSRPSDAAGTGSSSVSPTSLVFTQNGTKNFTVTRGGSGSNGPTKTRIDWVFQRTTGAPPCISTGNFTIEW